MRRFLILLNYAALAFMFVAAFLGALIMRGRGFEIHFIVSMISLTLTIPAHIGSGVYLVTHPVRSRTRIPLSLLNYIAAGFFLWATYAGFLIRQGIQFDYHFSVSIGAFIFTTAAHVLSPLFLTVKYRPEEPEEMEESAKPEEPVADPEESLTAE